MKIVSFNQLNNDRIAKGIPVHYLTQQEIDLLVDCIADRIKKEYAENPLPITEVVCREYAHTAIEHFKTILLGRRLIFEMQLDDDFFQFIEDHFAFLLQNDDFFP